MIDARFANEHTHIYETKEADRRGRLIHAYISIAEVWIERAIEKRSYCVQVFFPLSIFEEVKKRLYQAGYEVEHRDGNWYIISWRPLEEIDEENDFVSDEEIREWDDDDDDDYGVLPLL